MKRHESGDYARELLEILREIEEGARKRKVKVDSTLLIREDREKR